MTNIESIEIKKQEAASQEKQSRKELLIELRDMSIRTHERVLVKDVNVEIEAAKVTALCGPSGSGKSLTARAIMGVLDVSPGLVCGTLRYPGLTSEYISSISTSSFANLSDDELAKRDWFADVCGKGMTAQKKLLEDTRAFRGSYFTYSPQSASSALNPGRTIGHQLQMAISRRAQEPSDLSSEVVRILSEVGLRPSAAYSLPSELSGGMCQRAALAIAVAPKPKLVIADEPETGLDPVLRRGVIELLIRVCRQNGAGLLLISHHEETVDRIADKVVRLRPQNITKELS